MNIYKNYESNDDNKIYVVLSTLKIKKRKINNTLIEKHTDMLENPNFEQDYWSRTTEGIYKTGHDSIRLMKCLNYKDRSFYVNINYYDLMAGILICLKIEN